MSSTLKNTFTENFLKPAEEQMIVLSIINYKAMKKLSDDSNKYIQIGSEKLLLLPDNYTYIGVCPPGNNSKNEHYYLAISEDEAKKIKVGDMVTITGKEDKKTVPPTSFYTLKKIPFSFDSWSEKYHTTFPE